MRAIAVESGPDFTQARGRGSGRPIATQTPTGPLNFQPSPLPASTAKEPILNPRCQLAVGLSSLQNRDQNIRVWVLRAHFCRPSPRALLLIRIPELQ